MNIEPDFRRQMALTLLTFIQAGDSASIVGTYGVGKSNLFHHLAHHSFQQQDDVVSPEFLFIRVDCHAIPDFRERSVYSLILEGLETNHLHLDEASRARIEATHDRLLDAGQDVLKIRRHFKQILHLLLATHPERKLVLLMDQFDLLYQEADEALFNGLRGLREAFKYQIVFLLFTENQLIDLAELDPGRVEFYDLVAPRIIGLKPYDLADTQTMIERITARYDQLSLTAATIANLRRLTGGHAGLIKCCLDLLIRAELDGASVKLDDLPHLLAHGAIQHQCERIWHSLTLVEQDLLKQLTVRSQAEGRQALATLQMKGIVTTESTPAIFATLFDCFVSRQDNPLHGAISIDPKSRQVIIDGTPVAHLTPQEYRIMSTLMESGGAVVSIDELIDGGWPDSHGAVSNEAVAGAIKRLRKKIEPDSSNPRYIINVPGHGYKLETGIKP